MLKSGGKSGKYCSAVERVIAPRNYEYDPILSVDFASKQLTEHVISLPPPSPHVPGNQFRILGLLEAEAVVCRPLLANFGLFPVHTQKNIIYQGNLDLQLEKQ